MSQATSRSVPGTSRGTTAPLSSFASAASHSTAPVTWSPADSTRTSAVLGERDSLVPRLLQVLWNDEQFRFRFQRNDRRVAAAQPDR